MRLLNIRERRYLQAAGLLSLLCLALFFGRYLLTGHLHFWFIPGNLFLSWLSLLFAWLLVLQLRITPWSAWQNLALTFIWLVVLPNSWYVLTDFIHLYATGEVSLLYDIELISSLVICGFLLGFTSLYLVHKELLKRVGEMFSNLVVISVILLSSFAIYLGRDLRWNTWDVLADPSGLILNVSDRILDPFGHPRAINVTFLFFILLSVLYFAFWLFVRPLPEAKKVKS